MNARFAKMSISIAVFLWDTLVDVHRRILGKPPIGRYVVLYYHSIRENERERFARQLDEVVRRAHPMSNKDLHGSVRSGRFVSVTFDDGFASVARNAFPELISRGIPSEMFLPSGCLGRSPDWLQGTGHPDAKECILQPQEIRELARNPLISFGSHCRSHRNLLRLDDREAQREIGESKTELEAYLGLEVTSISFPHGDFDTSHVDFAYQTGYKNLFSISPQLYRNGNRVIGRVRVSPSDWPLEFILKISGAYRWLAVAAAVKQRLQGKLHGSLRPAPSVEAR